MLNKIYKELYLNLLINFKLKKIVTMKLAKTFTEVSKPIEQMKLQAGVEYYDHSAAYQLGGNNSGSFADFSYYLVNASVSLKF